MSSKAFTESLLRDLEENENGSFQLDNTGGEAFLSVLPPGKKGRPVKAEDILTRIHLFGIENFNVPEIDAIILKADGKPTKIGIWHGGQPEDAQVEIDIAEDKMSAFIYIIPPKHGGKSFTAEELIKIIESKIKSGINHQIVKNITEQQLFLKKILIAEGKVAENGKPGFIRTFFNHKKSFPELQEDGTGKVDFKNIKLIQSVKTGDLLAELIPSQNGIPGYTVTGLLAPEPGKEALWKIGANCRLADDKTKLYSAIDGRPILEKDGTIKVDEICYLENVDFSTGNIDFPGTIIVEGTVADDFKLVTRGSIIIKKSVGRVFLTAGEDIILSGGVMGKNGGLIEAGNDIYVKFSEQGKLIARGNIFIEEASLHSDIIAGDSVNVLGGRGEIIGGEIIAGRFISCNKLGAIVETKTNLMVGTPPDLIAELEKIKEEILKKKDIMVKINQSLNKIADDASRRDLLDNEILMLEKLNIAKEKYTNIIHALISQYETALSCFEPNLESFVSVEKIIYPGVEINLGNGKIFKSSLRDIHGKSFIFIGLNGMVTHSSNPPPKKKKKS